MPPQAAPPAPPPPSVASSLEVSLLGPFDRVRPLDAAGRTWLAYSAERGAAAVVKTLHAEQDRRGAGQWSTLAPHASLVRALGLSEGPDGLAVVYDYVAPDAYSRKAQGRTAFERRLRREPIPFAEVLRLSVLVCRGLEHAYAGGLLGHGNLKPSNLLLGLDGGLRLSEAGLAGNESPAHMAPERFEGAPADELSDLYSLGILLFQMTAGGQPPFDAPAAGSGEEAAARYREDMRQLQREALVPRVDSLLAAVLERCLQKEPRDRFASVLALRAELEDLLRRETGLVPDLRDSAEEAGWEKAQHGLALLAVGRAEPALRAFDEALPALPPVASVLAVRATAINVLGRHGEALEAAEEALSVDPQYSAAWRQKGESLFALGRLEDAAAALAHATMLAPRDAATFVSFAHLLGTMGRLPQALEAYDRAVGADPDHVDVWLERGRTLLEAGRPADAAGALLRFIDLSSSSHPARRKAEELLREARRLVEAASPASRAAEPPPTPAPLETSAPPEADAPYEPPPAPAPSFPANEPVFLPEDEAEPQSAPAGRELGVRLFREGRLEEALSAFDRAILLDRRHAETWANRASLLFRLGRPEEGLAGHEQALGLEPRLGSSWLNKALIEKALGRPADAKRSLLELTSLEPPPDARLAAQANEQLRALQNVAEAPRTALGHLRAGAQNAQAGRLEEALADLDAALQEEPLLGLAWLYKGDVLASQARAAEAALAYEEGLGTDPGDSRLLMGLARCRARLGEYDTALAVIDRLLSSTGDDRAAAQKLRQAVEARRAAANASTPTPLPEPPARPEPEPTRATEPAEPPPPAEAAPPPHPEPPTPAAAPAPAAVPIPPAPVEAAPRIDPLATAATLLAQGRAADALLLLDQQLAAGADAAPVFLLRGDCLRALGRKEEAAASYDQALKRAPQDPLAWIKKGEALDAATLFAEAVACYDQAVALNPQHQGAWNSKGVGLTRLSRVEEAHYCFMRALDIDPHFGLARFNCGAAEDMLGQAGAAVVSFETFLSIAPPNLKAQIQHAQKRLQALKAPRA